MASSAVPLWSGELHKEAVELMVGLWPTIGDAKRKRLIDAIIEGPPIEYADRSDEEISRSVRAKDRGIFDRLMILARLGQPPLPPIAQEKLERLSSTYPDWQLADGEQALFSVWMDAGDGYKGDISEEVLRRLSGESLLQTLREKGATQEGRLELWSLIVSNRPARGVGLLKALSSDPREGDDRIWSETLYGLRQASSRSVVIRRIVDTLTCLPQSMLANSRMHWPVSAILEAAAKQTELPFPEASFWRLWDRLFEACLRSEPEDAPEGDDWVGQALNHPLGRLATALVDLLFRRRLKAGEGIPPEFRKRLVQTLPSSPSNLRLARVILASRLLYLFSIDPPWTTAHLIPGFDWAASEVEATALWRGYGWTCRINVGLWVELSQAFFDTFVPKNNQRLGAVSARLAELLMAVGVDFSADLVPADRARDAIRSMKIEDRTAAVTWLYHYISGPHVDNQTPAARANRSQRADRVWSEKVAPWLDRVWPRDVETIAPQTSENFALLAIATDNQFEAAVTFLLPYISRTTRWGYIAHELSESRHPDDQPVTTLLLLGAVVALENGLFTKDLRAVLDRVSTASPELQQHVTYRALDQRLRSVGVKM